MISLPLRQTILAATVVLSALALIHCGDSGDGGNVTITITTPGIVGPNGATPTDNPPTLTVTNVTVSDGSGATYTFQIATDQVFANILRQTSGVGQGSAQTTWTPDEFGNTGLYFWRARGEAGGVVGPWSAVAQFIIGGGGVGPGETQVLFDSLTGGMTIGEQHGGTLTPNGWRVNTNGDFLRYEVPTVENGYAEWQNLGLTPRGANDASHMLFGMWDPSAGAYVRNAFRVHVQKLWSNPHNPPFIRLRWISQGREHDVGTNFTNWDAGHAYTWRVDWGPAGATNIARVFLDDIEIMQTQYNRPYSPRTHFIELGIGERGESVIDAIYKNFLVVRR